jgi:hypothetical protein
MVRTNACKVGESVGKTGGAVDVRGSAAGGLHCPAVRGAITKASPAATEPVVPEMVVTGVAAASQKSADA